MTEVEVKTKKAFKYDVVPMIKLSIGMKNI
jgi:hypothetical protein